MRKDLDPRATAKQQVVAVHECLDDVSTKLDAHIVKTDANFALAQKSREEIAATAAETAQVVKENRDGFRDDLAGLRKTLEEMQKTIARVDKTVGGYEGVRKAAFALAGAAALGAAGFVGNALAPHFLPPPPVATKADLVAHTADRYTGAEAAKDRAAQDARDQQILATLQQVQATAQADHQTLVGTDHAANPRARR